MSIEKYTNEHGKECYRGVTPDTTFDSLDFHAVDMGSRYDDVQFALHTNLGSITVLDRLTGFGWRDTETGFRDTDGKFWLASGDFDVRFHTVSTVQDAIDMIKSNANTCVGNK